jgi:hypothetical protein
MSFGEKTSELSGNQKSFFQCAIASETGRTAASPNED